jgi:hypothetical protein
MPPFARGATSPKLRPQHKIQSCHLGYSHLPLGNLTMPSRCCLIVEGGATLRGVPILYRGALLPLSEDGDTIDHVLGAANHRALLADDAPTKQVTRTRWV